MDLDSKEVEDLFFREEGCKIEMLKQKLKYMNTAKL